VLVSLGKCAEANRSLQRYQVLCPLADDIFVLHVQEKVDACSGAQPAAQPVSAAQVKPLASNINTPFPDIAPQRFADKMYFTTVMSYSGGRRKVNRIFTAIKDEPARPFPENPKEVDIHATNVALTPNADRIYYTLCKDDSIATQEKCEIWYRDRTYEGEWGHPVRLPRHINLPGFTTTQPNVGYDAPSNNKLLFFVSNRPGSKGGLDIWYTIIKLDGSFEEPVCLPVNTEADDITPYFFTPSQTLYFSSNQPGGQGGFDIYRTDKAATQSWTRPQNLEAPLNTPYDEHYFCLHQGSHTGYFSSNRPNAACPDANVYCQNFDLYEVSLFATLDISIFNAVDSSALTGSTVELIDMATGKIDTTVARLPGHHSKLLLGLGKTYRIIVSQPGYYPVYSELNTQGKKFSARLEDRFYLKSMR
jgi:hypothetical protein